MRIYKVETRKFDFDIVAPNDQAFKLLFRRAWRKHCKEWQIPFDAKFLKVLFEDAYYLDLEPLQVYKDQQLFMEG
jgi:hypothetical protein